MTLALVPLAGSFQVTGLPALLIVLAIVAVFVIGIVAVVRGAARRVRR